MGVVSSRLSQHLRKASRRERHYRALETARQLPTAAQLVRSGHTALHAEYLVIQNLLSVFAELASVLPECEEYYDLVSKAEDEYLPSGPPMSPLTTSYFTSWAFCDVRFGPERETMASCLASDGSVLAMSAAQVAVLRAFGGSRMGIYLHEGRSKAGVTLRELVTNNTCDCQVPAGYLGEGSELWYVRLCPPAQDLGPEWVVLTTPYVLTGASQADWLAYLNKSIAREGTADRSAALHDFLKYGRTPMEWPEFVFQAFKGSRNNVIFLAGLPDVASSRPHSPENM